MKSITGMGLPIIAIPIAALFVDLETAVVVMSIPSITANSVLCYGERQHRSESRDLPILVGAGVIGAVLGTVALVSVPSEPLEIALVVTLVLYIAHSLTNPSFIIGKRQGAQLSPLVGFVAGIFQGSVGISGPIVGSWIHAYKLKPGAHIFSVTLIFAVSGAVQLAILIATGEFDGRWLASFAALIPVLLSIPLGKKLRGKLSSELFNNAVIAVLAASSISILANLIF